MKVPLKKTVLEIASAGVLAIHSCGGVVDLVAPVTSLAEAVSLPPNLQNQPASIQPRSVSRSPSPSPERRLA